MLKKKRDKGKMSPTRRKAISKAMLKSPAVKAAAKKRAATMKGKKRKRRAVARRTK